MKEPQPYTFGRIAGALCLDFTNTASWVADRLTTEHLNDFGDLVRWCTESAILPTETAAMLFGEAEQLSACGAAVLAESVPPGRHGRGPPRYGRGDPSALPA